MFLFHEPNIYSFSQNKNKETYKEQYQDAGRRHMLASAGW
jgi:hypothetical protein